MLVETVDLEIYGLKTQIKLLNRRIIQFNRLRLLQWKRCMEIKEGILNVG
jgi:hypothetical protein